MKKTFQKTLIAASVGAVMAVAGVAANAGTTATTNLLFPYITTATGAYTFISISNQKAGAAPATKLHFTYATKPISAANTASCEHIDGDATTTDNDLMQFEIRNQVNLPSTFGDTTSVPKYFPNTAVAADRHGMLVVNNFAGSDYGSGATYNSAVLYGEARLINTATGLAAGYSTDDLHTANAVGSAIDFSAGTGPEVGLSTKVISWFADPTVSTSWFVIPLGTEQAMAFDGNVSATYQVQSAAATQAAVGVGGHYNNNEGFQSSTARQQVTCVGTFTRSALLGPLNADYSANGGWGNFVAVVSAGGTATEPNATNAFQSALVYKLETTNAVGKASFVTREPTL